MNGNGNFFYIRKGKLIDRHVVQNIYIGIVSTAVRYVKQY